MAKRRGPPSLNERTLAPEHLLAIPAVGSIVFGIALALVFWPGGSVVAYWEQAGLVGLFFFAVFAFFIALVASGRQNAPKIVTGHRVFQGATSERIELAPRFAPIDRNAVRMDSRVSEEKRAEVEDALRRIPGTNADGEPVPLGYRWGGGLV
ncbi:MAG: hypothetical protein ACREDE_10460, partial [Thermoplasmata archaeon]